MHWFKRYPTYKTMTLKMGSRSPKTLYVLTLSQRYIHSSLINIHPFVRAIPHFSNKINFCQLTSDLENEVKVTKVQ